MSLATDIHLERTLEDGSLIEFEERLTGFRAYWYTAPGRVQRTRQTSVTTILGAIMPDDALRDWYEARGAESALVLERMGMLGSVEPPDAIEAIRSAGMGAKGAAKTAATRGTSIHSILQAYAERGEVPNPKDFPEDYRGYIRGLVRWLLHSDPEPVAVERLVVHPEFGYAGRLDLRARMRGREYIIDLKTNRRTAIYRKACLQAVAYHVADVRSGAEPADGELLVAVGPDGSFAEAFPPDGTAEAWAAGLEYHRRLKGMGDIREVR